MKKLGWAGMLLITAWLILPDIAIAADSSSLAWRTPLEALRDNITDKVVPAVLNIMIAVTGIMIMFGDSNHRRMLNIVLGTAMAAQIYYALKAFGLGEILNPAVSVVVNPVDLTSIKITDNVEDFNPLSSFMRQFIHIVDNGSTVLVGYALELMGFGIPDWVMGDKLLVDYSSKWIRSGKEDDGKYGWVAKILAEGIENARKNQEDLDERMGTMNEILENSQDAEGNMEAMQSESQMQGLMDSEITRRGQLLANQALVQSAR
jgi:type IV secretory pathway VirB2 component (pilin)